MDDRQQEEVVLPPGWERAVDPRTGKTYYANRSTRETRWTPPSPRPPIQKEPPAAPPTPEAHPHKPEVAAALHQASSTHDVSSTARSSSRSSSSKTRKRRKHDHGSPHHHDSKERSSKEGRSAGSSSSTPRDSGGSGSQRRSATSSSKEGQQSKNPLYAASKYNAASTDPSKLISMARTMLNKSAAFPSQSIDSDLELNSITPGQIADLCHIQHRSKTSGQTMAYTPLNPFRMSVQSEAPPDEGARIKARLAALKRKLKEFEGAD